MTIELDRLMHSKPWLVFALLAVLSGAPVAAAEPVFPVTSASETDDSETPVDIPDAALRKAVEEALGKAPGDLITRGEMATRDLLWKTISATGVEQLNGIEYAINLGRLELYQGTISNLAPLAGLTSLTWLDLSRNLISDLSPLTGLTSLMRLNLSQNYSLSDLSPLAGLTSLTSIELRTSSVSDLSPLAGLTSLGRLVLSSSVLSSSSVSDLSPLAGLTSLTSLDLSSSSVSDLSPLAGLTSLRFLDLSSNLISDLSPLASLTSLTFLRLTSRSVSDLSPLAGLTSLTGLNLRSSSLSDLSPLAGLTSLTGLNLRSGSVSDLSPLAGLTSLTSLDLSLNFVSDVSPLVANDGLGHGDYVNLKNNFLGTKSIEEHIPTLLQRGVEVDFTEYIRLPEIPDVGLRRASERALYLEGDDLAHLLRLDASDRGIEDLTGLEGAANLRALFLDRNKITDIAPLAGLGSLRSLTLTHNMVEDWVPLADLKPNYLALDGNSLRELPPLSSSLNHLYLADNSISDIAPLADIWLFLRELDVSANSIRSLEPLFGLDDLRYLNVNDNQVADLFPLNFDSLQELLLRNNAVRDISPLLNGEELLMVDVRRNPLSDDALSVLETLRERRVTVLAGETVPYFPAAGDSRQGFVRIVNRSDEDGHVFIEAVDDAGARIRPVRLNVGPREAVHFNSADLEYGNAAKGLSGGIGPPTAGDWRLSVISALDVEVLSYIRTEDGFVTAMHDVAADAMAPFFNPGSNERQRSILRVVNTEAEPAKWTTGGYDDRGNWRAMAGSMLVPPQRALTLTAHALENTHGLGDGHGKWRLRVRGFPWFAMSLLESPTGHLVNLSTAADGATPLADGATMHRLPLFPAADGLREGFARVINRSYSSGEVAIEAVDDGGARSGPVRLEMGARHAVHFNSTDLEDGNAAKGLVGGLGVVGKGDWRLEVKSELDLMVLSYARTDDGFLTSLHDLAPAAEDGSHRVVFFNPGSNTRQVSKLRLINDGERAAAATVTGIDDEGSGSGTIAVTVPAGFALTFTSAELEAGGNRFAGRLGDGEGKWRLRVRSDEPIAVMSLLETPSGHLTNVSTGTAD